MKPTDKDKGQTSFGHVLKYTGIFGGVQGLSILISLVRNKLATKLLGAAGYGIMGIYISIGEFVNNTSNFGIPFSSVRNLSELFESGTEVERIRFIKVIRTWCLWTALLASLLCIGGAPLLGRWFFDTGMTGTWNIALLAPMAFSMAIMAGEISILKGLRHLKRVAAISALSAISTLCITIPIFWALHTTGIILAMDLSVMVTAGIHLAFTTPLYPWKVSPLSRQVFTDGLKMVYIGVPYVLAGIAGSGVALALPALLLYYGDVEDIGFYRAGYALMVTYAGIVFTALDADFFPRLSSVCHDAWRRNYAINLQIRVCTMLISPMLIALVLGMPIVLRILYAEEFAVVGSMAICASFYTFLRGISTPIAYTALACGDSLIYMAMELIYDALSLIVIVLCYREWGLTGAGIGLSLSALFDLSMIGIIYGHHYRFRMNSSTLRQIASQGVLLTLTVGVCFYMPRAWKYVAGCVLFVLSASHSYRILDLETEIPQKIKRRLRIL